MDYWWLLSQVTSAILSHPLRLASLQAFDPAARWTLNFLVPFSVPSCLNLLNFCLVGLVSQVQFSQVQLSLRHMKIRSFLFASVPSSLSFSSAQSLDFQERCWMCCIESRQEQIPTVPYLRDHFSSCFSKRAVSHGFAKDAWMFAPTTLGQPIYVFMI